MRPEPEEGSVCVSANTGAVGEVKNGKCHITMALEVEKFYTSAQREGRGSTSQCTEWNPDHRCFAWDRIY